MVMILGQILWPVQRRITLVSGMAPFSDALTLGSGGDRVGVGRGETSKLGSTSNGLMVGRTGQPETQAHHYMYGEEGRERAGEADGGKCSRIPPLPPT